MNILLSLLIDAAVYLWLFFGLYVLVMGIYRAHLKKPLRGLVLVFSLPWVAIGLVVDLIANCTLAWLIFKEPPRELLVTTRLKRYIALGAGHNYELAYALCQKVLDLFDPDGDHC